MAASTQHSRSLPTVGLAEPAGSLSAPQVEPIPTLVQVYDEHAAYVVRCMRSLGVRDAALDDAVQDVFLVVQDKLGGFDGACALRTWLYAIVLRVARRYRERAAKANARSSSAEPVSQARTDEHAERNQRLLLARRALEALDDDKREVFVLAQIEEMSAPEIAQVMGLPVNTVYSRLRAARQEFEAALKRLRSRDEWRMR